MDSVTKMWVKPDMKWLKSVTRQYVNQQGQEGENLLAEFFRLALLHKMAYLADELLYSFDP